MLNKYYYNFNFKMLSKLLSKFMLKGKRYNIEKLFDNVFLLLKKKKKNFLHTKVLESLVMLKVDIGAKIFKFSKNKRVRKQKKGVKVAIRVQIIPVKIEIKPQYILALKWLVLRIKKSPTKILSKAIISEILAVSNRETVSALQDKKSFQQLILLNRGRKHFRW